VTAAAAATVVAMVGKGGHQLGITGHRRFLNINIKNYVEKKTRNKKQEKEN
jgi:hypothetical protein